LSETESLEPIGDVERDDVAPAPAGGEIRGEIDQARAATDRFRAKATDLISELRAREARAREEADVARAAADEVRTRAQEAIDEAKRVEARSTTKAREAIREAAKRAGAVEKRSKALERSLAEARNGRQRAERAAADLSQQASAA
jgi:hypothetical protein